MIWDVDKEKVVDCTTPMTYEEYKRMTNQYCRNVAHEPMTKLCNTCEYLKYCARSGIEEVGCDRYKKDTTTNKEWLQTATTEQLAEWIAKQKCDGCNDEPYDEKHGTCKYCMTKKTEQIREWLKQPHRNE